MRSISEKSSPTRLVSRPSAKFKLAIVMMVTLVGTWACDAQAAEMEFRGLWVHNWRPGLLCPAEADQTVQWAREANINALIVQVRRVGDAYYESSYEPRAWNILAGPEFDPLSYVIEKAHRYGMEVHAWVNAYRVWKPDRKISPPVTHIIKTNPEWLSKDYNGSMKSDDGVFLDPGVPQVREHLVKIIADIVSKYNVDGVMLDYIRYPGKNWGYNDIAVSRFNGKYGRKGKPSPDDPLWSSWRRQQVTETVSAIYKEVHRIKPYVKVSAATIAWGSCPADFTRTSAYSTVFQDWRSWMQEGILDANMPMNYKDNSDPKQRKWFADWLDGMKRWSYGRHVYSGQMVFENNVSGVIAQVELARRKDIDGTAGLAFSQSQCKATLVSKLRATVFAQAASVPPMPWKSRVAREQIGEAAGDVVAGTQGQDE